jgi:hypothetical protein
VQVWDLPTGREEASLALSRDDMAGNEADGDYMVWSVALMPDGQRIVSGGSDGMVRIWSWESRRMVASYTLRRKQRSQAELVGVAAVAVGANGQQIVVGDQAGVIWVLDVESSRPRRLGRHRDWVSTIAVAPDGLLAVSGGGDGIVRVWDLATGREQYSFTGHRGDVRAVVMSPDGREIVSCGGAGGGVVDGADAGDGAIRVWNRHNGQQLLCLKGHSGGVLGIAVTPDGTEIVSVGMDHTIRIWDRNTGAQIRGRVDGIRQPV